jgi:hypothetical protein
MEANEEIKRGLDEKQRRTPRVIPGFPQSQG